MRPYGSHTVRWIALLGALVACASSGRDAGRGVDRARVHLAERDSSSAERELEAAGARDGDDPVAARMLGSLYRERGTIHGRLLSQYVLEPARARHPDDLDLAMELARTYFAQGFYPDAVRISRDALAREPGRCDALRLLALYHFQNWKRMNEYSDDLSDARLELRAALACDPNDADLALRALVAGYARGDSIGAECDACIARFPARPEFPMMRGTIAFDVRRYDACARDYAAALDLMDDATRSVYQSLTFVLAAREDERYRSATEDVRTDFQRGLWLVSDADPTTEVNPRALEHIYRLFVADCLYSNEPTGKRGWETDRGEAFVRFGRPIDIDYNMGSGFKDGKVETWSFLTAGVFHQLVFVDQYLNGNPRIPYDADVTLHLMRHSPATSQLEPDAFEIPGFVDAYAFRDDLMSSSIYLTMAVDVDALHAALDVSRVDRFVLRGAYFDQWWQREGEFSDTVRASELDPVLAGGGRALELVHHVRVPCDRYHLAMAFEDPLARARATGRRDTDALRFADDRLALSDVLLFRDQAPESRLVTIDRGGARMRPNVEREVAHGERLRAYVEIYNLSLATSDGRRASSYELRFAIFPARAGADPPWVDWGRRAVEWAGFGEDEEPVIAQTFRREGRAHDDHESMAIDVDVLEDGRYELVVEVRDRASNQRAAVHAPFWKESGSVAGRKR